MSQAHAPRIAFLRKQLQANLILTPSIYQPRPDHAELDAALPKENDQGVERAQLVANRAQPGAGWGDIESVRQYFKEHARSVSSPHPYRQDPLRSSLMTPVYFHVANHLKGSETV
jgi:hypothetical protein